MKDLSSIHANTHSFRFAVILLLPFFFDSAKAEFIADGVTLTQLTDDGKSTAVSWAYHGNLIAFIREVSDTQSQLLIMNSDGSNPETVTPIGNPFFVEWSWGGTKLSYEFSSLDEGESQGGVFIYDALTKRTLSISAPYPRKAIDEDDGPFWSADDRYVAYKVRPGPARTRELYVADTTTGKTWRLLPGRGQGKEQRWSPSVTPKICLEIEASGGGFDIATVNPDSSGLILLTNVGAQPSVSVNEPRWSPTGEWVGFTNNIDMTQTEREQDRTDCWIARPDGSESRNLTNATSPAIEKQLEIDGPVWSWDGRWILAEGERFDYQGNNIETLYLIDPVNGGYWPMMTSDPQRTGEIDELGGWKWSYDSSKIAAVIRRNIVRNWGTGNQLENTRWILTLYDIHNKTTDDILILSEEQDRKRIGRGMSWSPDNRSILLTLEIIVSEAEKIRQPDVYRLDLPERFIHASASEQIGPPMGRSETVIEQETSELAPSVPIQEEVTERAQPVPSAPPAQQEKITQAITPMHLTVEEAMSSLPTLYSQYISVNTPRNTLIFKGPPELLEGFLFDLELIDSPAPHILVDLLAVELSDEANRSLGLDWTYAEGRFALFQPEGGAIRDLTPDERLDGLMTFPGLGQMFYQGVGKLPREFFIRLNTLEKDGKAIILANPRTVAMSGKESVIQIRKTLNFFFTEGYDTAGRPIVKKSDISADTIGRITPILLADGRIYLVVDVSVGTFTFTPTDKLPELTTRQSQTEVSVGEGETLVIGGLRQQEVVHSTARVPILGSVPVIKPLFTNKKKDTRHSVLTIFMTPQVLKPGSPPPAWRQLNEEEHKIVPIMNEASADK